MAHVWRAISQIGSNFVVILSKPNQGVEYLLLVRMFRSSPSASRHVSVVGFPVHPTAKQRRYEISSYRRGPNGMPAAFSWTGVSAL